MSTNDSFQNQNPIQNFVFKILKGVILRIVLVIAMPILFGIFIPKLAEELNIKLPGWSKTVMLIFLIVLLIAELVRYIISEYFVLKNGFQNLEQNLAQSMTQAPVEYVEIPLGQQGYGQMYGQGYPQNVQYNSYNQAYQNGTFPSVQGYTNAHPTQQTQQPGKSGGCLGKAVAFIISTLIFGSIALALGGGLYFYFQSIQNFDETTAIVEHVSHTTQIIGYDEENGEETRDEYEYTYAYTYGDNVYRNKDTKTSTVNNGDSIQMYVDPENPEHTIEKIDDTSIKILIVVTGVDVIIWLLILIHIFKRQEKRSY